MVHIEIAEIRATLLEQQGGVCAICRRVPKIPCLDHDHKTGMIRAVLCMVCNGMEGRIKNAARRVYGAGREIEFLTSLISYWELHDAEPSGMAHPSHKKKKKKKKKSAKSKHIKALIGAGLA